MMSAQRSVPYSDLILQRICGEFLEMPGLRLTCRQAQRLWGFDEHTCHELLDALVEAGFLCQTADGTYKRMTEGRAGRMLARKGHSGRLMAVFNDDLELAALTNVPVLITAEHRAQRETYARLIHANGTTRQGPFSTFCDPATTGIPGRLSSASASRHISLRQQFDKGRGGTLFIDDLATLTPDVQAQLLSLLQVPLASRATMCADSLPVRVIAGASRHLELERATGAFCEPLFYRLNIVHIDLFTVDAAASIRMAVVQSTSRGLRTPA